MNNIAYLLTLHTVNGLGPIRLKRIVEYFKDPKLAWEATNEELISLGIPQTTADLINETRKKVEPDQYFESIKASGIGWVTIFDDKYPKLLRQIYDPPVVLYYKGNLNVLNTPSISVVGSRKMTAYGKMVTKQFTKDLVNARFTIVSGLAMGIDSQAHQTAIEEKGETVAVLGGGLNNIFPAENKGLAAKIADGFGTVISEFGPQLPAKAGNFPRRNRIISALSLATLVVEAAQNSGSLITAHFALKYGRKVFAVPGPITSSLAKGPIELIKLGARPVSESYEILDELGIKKVLLGEAREGELLSEDQRKVLEVLEEIRHIDEIGRILNFPAKKISSLLIRMEISGLVHSLGNGKFCRR